MFIIFTLPEEYGVYDTESGAGRIVQSCGENGDPYENS
jgi:hypothetical protein